MTSVFTLEGEYFGKKAKDEMSGFFLAAGKVCEEFLDLIEDWIKANKTWAEFVTYTDL